MAIRQDRFVEFSKDAIRIEDAATVQKKAFSKAIGFGNVLKKTEEEAVQMLTCDRRTNDLLNEAWEKAKNELEKRHIKPDDKTAFLSAHCRIAVFAYTLEKPDLYRYFNIDSRGVTNFFVWENFQYKGLWLLLHKAVASKAAIYDASFLVYRACMVEFAVEIGSKIMFQQFTSTTKNKKVAESFLKKKPGTMFILEVTVALAVESLSAYPSEDEFLVSPNDGFTVTDVKQNGATKEIYLKETDFSFIV